MAIQGLVWYELETTDIDAALAFYRPLLGWDTQDFPDPSGARYAIVMAGGKGVGGIGAKLPGTPAPYWAGYVATPDMDASVQHWTAQGGAVLRQPHTIPMVGRLALLADPQGARLAMLQPAPNQPQSEAFNPMTPGHAAWNELHTPDPEAALAFYTAQLGWTAGDVISLGSMGSYQLLHGDRGQMGGIAKSRPGMPPLWVFYFAVPNIQAAAAAVTATGGTTLHEPMPVPGGAMVVNAKDPQGAHFAMVGPG